MPENNPNNIDNQQLIAEQKRIQTIRDNAARMRQSLNPTQAPSGVTDTQLGGQKLTDSENNFSDYGFNYTLGIDNEELRAQRQTSAEKWANATGKMLTLFGTTLADNTVGTVVGVANLATGGEGGFWNNPFTKEMVAIQEGVEQALPNYYTKQELDNPWYNNLDTANFWADKVMKNLGFAAGAAAGAILTGGATSSILGMKELSKRVAKGLTSLGADGKSAINLTQAGENIGESLLKEAKMLKNKQMISKVSGAILGAQAEARFEAIHAHKEFIENTKRNLMQSEGLTEDQADKRIAEDKDIQDNAVATGNMVFGLNVGLLSLTNFSEFSQAIAKGYNPNKYLTRNIDLDIAKGVAKGTGSKAGKTANAIWRVGAKPFITEGVVEEMGQASINRAAQDYYLKKNNKEAQKDSNTLLQSIMEGLSETYGTAAGWEEGFIGGISGMIGLGPLGGSISEYKQLKEENKNTKQAIEQLNNVMSKPEFKNGFESLVRKVSYNQDKQKSLDEDDMFEYKNADASDFVNTVNTFIDGGKFEDLIDYIESANNADPDQIKSMIKNAKSPQDQYGPFENFTDDEIKSKISSNVQKLKKKAEEIRNIREAIETKFPKLSRAGISSLVNMSATIKDVDNRLDSIKLEKLLKVPAISLAIEDLKQRKNKVSDIINLVEDHIKENPEDVDLRQDVADVIKLIKRRKDYAEAYLKAFENPTELENDLLELDKVQELFNKAKNEKILNKFKESTDTDKKFGFDSDEFEFEEDEVEENTLTLNWTKTDKDGKQTPMTAKSTGRTKDKDGKDKPPRPNAEGTGFFVDYDIDGKPQQIFVKNGENPETPIAPNTINRSTRRVRYKKDDPNTLIDDDSNEYSAEDIIDKLRLVKTRKEKREDLILEARFNQLNRQDSANKIKTDLIKKEIDVLENKIKDALSYLSKALSNPSKTTFVKVEGKKFKQSVEDIEAAVLQLEANLELKKQELNDLEFQTAAAVQKDRYFLSQYDNIESDNKNLENKIKEVKTVIAEAEERLSFLKKIRTLARQIFNRLASALNLLDRDIVDSTEFSFDTNIEEIKNLKKLIDSKKQELEKLISLQEDFQKENEQIEEELMKLINAKNGVTVKKANIKKDNKKEVEEELEEGAKLIKEYNEEYSPKKSIKDWPSTTTVPTEAGKRWEKAINYVNLNGDDKVSLKVVTNKTRPDLFKGEPTDDHIKVILYINGKPVKLEDDNTFSIIDEENTEDLIYTSLTDTSLEFKDYGNKFNDALEDEEETQRLKDEYQEFRNFLIETVSDENPIYIIPKDKSRGVINTFDIKFRGQDGDTTLSVYDIFSFKEVKNSTIVVPTGDKIVIGDREISVKPGMAYMITKEGNILPLINRKLNDKEADTVLLLLRLYATGLKEIPINEGSIEDVTPPKFKKTKKGTKVKKTYKYRVWKNVKKAGWKKIKGGKSVFIFKANEGPLKGKFISYNDNKIPQKFRKDAKSTASINIKGSKINTLEYIKGMMYIGKQDKDGKKPNIQTEIYFDKGKLYFYDEVQGKQVSIDFTTESLNKPENKERLKKFILNKYHQVNSKLVQENKPFFLLTETDVNSTSFKTTEFSSYTGYLLNNKHKNEDRPSKDIPLTTNIEGDPKFKSQYFTFEKDNKATPTKKSETISNVEEELISDKSPEHDNLFGDWTLDDFADGGVLPTGMNVVNEEPPNPFSNKSTFDKAKNKINMQKAKEWLHARFPNLKVEEFEGLIEGNYFGRAMMNAVQLSKQANEGTEYHEAFHIATLMHLSNEQLDNLYAEAKEVFGLPLDSDIENLKKIYPNLSKEQLVEQFYEEKLADAFEDYVLSNGKVVPSKKLNNIFSILWNMIKKLFNIYQNSNIEELFQNIDKGTLNLNIVLNRRNNLKSNKSVLDPMISLTETKEIMESLTSLMMTHLFKGYKYNLGQGEVQVEPKTLNELKSLKSNDLKGLYLRSIADTITFLNRAKQNITKDPDISKELKDKLIFRNLMLKDYLSSQAGIKQVATHHINEFLPQFNLEINENDIDKTREEEDEITSRDNFADSKHLKISSEGNSTALIKLLIGSLPQVTLDKQFVLSELGLPKLVEFGKTFNFVSNILAGERNFNKMIEKLDKYSAIRPELKLLVHRLTNFQSDTWHNFKVKSEFQQTFAKTKLNYYMWMLGKDKIYPFEATSDSQSGRIVENWMLNLKETIGKAGSVLRRNTDGTIIFNSTLAPAFKSIDADKKTDIKTKAIKKLKLLGIDIPNPENYKGEDLYMHAKQISEVALKSSTLEELYKKQSGRIKELANLVSSEYGDVELQHIGPDGETRYSITLNNLLSIISDTINDLPVDNARNILFEEFPHLNNVYTQNSYWLKKGGMLFDEDGDRRVVKTVDGKKQYAQFKLSIIEGAKQENESDSGEVTSDMKFPDKLWMSFNSIMMGTHPFLRAADKSLEFAFETQNVTSPKTIGTDKFKILDILKGYLKDEINRAQVLNTEIKENENASDKEIVGGSNIQYYNSSDGIHHGRGLFLFKEIINLEGLLNILQKGDIDEFLSENSDIINEQLTSFIEKLKKDFTNKLLDNKVIVTDSEEGYKNNGISEDVLSMEPEYISNSNNITLDSWNNIIEAFVSNGLIANIEQTKLFTGDPALFKSIADFYKRTAGPVGTKKLAFVDNYVNHYLARNAKRQDKKVSKGDFNIIASEDVSPISKYVEIYENALSNSGIKPDKLKEMMKKSYRKSDEGDAQGIITLDEYREFMIRTASWTDGHKRAYEILIDPERKKGDVIDPKILAYFQPLKAQYFGPKYQKLIDPNSVNSTTFLKFSLLPLIPSIIEGTSLEKLNESLIKNKIGIHVFGSGEKLGAFLESSGKLRSFYNKNGTINTKIEKNSIQTLDYRFLGIQVEIAPKVKDNVIFGTQFRKLLLSNFYVGGVAKAKSFIQKVNGVTVGITTSSSEQAEKKVDRYNEIISKITNDRWQKLLDKLGAVKEGDYYKFKNVSNLVRILTEEAKSRKAPDNLVDSIQTITDEDLKTVKLAYNIDALPTRNKIENILMSLVNNNVIKQKVKGGGKIQGSISGFENSRNKRTFNKNGQIESSSELLFYRKGAYGETLPAQLKLPLPKDMINYVEVQGGLNEFNEKLRRLYNEVYTSDGTINKELTPRYNKALQDEIGIDPRLFNIIGYRIPTQGLNSIDSFEIVEFLDPHAAELVLVPSEIVAKSGSDFDIDKLNVLLANYKVNDDNTISYNKEEEGEEGLMNELIQLAQEILSSPENFVELITPNTDYDVKNLADDIKKAKKIGGNPRNHKIILWDYIQDIGKYFLVGKAGVGQLALHITHHSLAQKIGLSLPSLAKLNFKGMEKEFSMAREYDINGEKGNKISDILSQFLNGFVDVAKEPFVFFLNASTSTNDTIAYLLRRGVPLNTIGYFMTQPVIDEYIKEQSINESEMLKVKDASKYQQDIIDELIKKYTTKYLELTGENTIEPRIITQARLEKYAKSQSEIEDIFETDPEYSLLQIQVLTDFLKYQEEGKIVAKLMKVTKPDTTTPKNINATKLEPLTIDTIIKSGLFSQETIDKINNNTLLKAFKNAQGNIKDLYKELFVSEVPKVIDELNKVLEVYNNTSNDKNTKKSDNDINEVLDLFKNDFITYLLLTEPIITEKGVRVGLNNFYEKYLTKGSETNVAYLLRKAQANKRLKDNVFIKEMQVILNNPMRKVDNIKLFNKRLSKFNADLLTNAFEELLIEEEPIANLVLRMGIIQGGLQNSFISFLDKIPYKFYAGLAQEAINNFLQNPSDISTFVDQMYRNNYMNNNLVPKGKDANVQGDTYISHEKSNTTKYPYVKVWKWATKNEVEIKKLKELGLPTGEFRLFRAITPYRKGFPRTYKEVSKLGDSFYFKEYYKSLKPSILQSNNVKADTYEVTPDAMFSDTFVDSDIEISNNIQIKREYTPENITKLKSNEIFVFGSNTGDSKGGPQTHGKGAALLAKQKFGAIQGQAEGLQGQSYAVITKKYWDVEKSSSLVEIYEQLSKFLDFASNNKDKKFLVTKLGSSLAGYNIQQIKNIFERLYDVKGIPSNVILPKEYEVREDNQSITFNDLSEFSTIEKQEILKAFAAKHKLNEKQALETINKMITKNKENAIEFLNKCK